MSQSIVEDINQFAGFLVKEDIGDWVVPKLLDYYSSKITYLASQTYKTSNDVAKGAFNEIIKENLCQALETFLLEKEHWRDGRDVDPYLRTVLNRIANIEERIFEGAATYNALMCPACRIFNKREPLVSNGKLWQCQECSSQIEFIKAELPKLPPNNMYKLQLESRLVLFKNFAIHSRKGFRCPDCGRFIPDSTVGAYGVSCPYPDCVYFGKSETLETMAHPTGLTKRFNLSLQATLKEDSDSSLQSIIPADAVGSDISLEIDEKIRDEFEMLKGVMEEQLRVVHNNSTIGTILQKSLMYEAYLKMLEMYPQDMVSYLVHRKVHNDVPIQSKIFQEYIKLMQDTLPCKITKLGREYEIISLDDPLLGLFEGISVFKSVVEKNGIIPNETAETYIGGVTFKDYGSCFIGMVIDIFGPDGKSLKPHMLEYGFSQIQMDDSVPVGTLVEVKHYRIPSHYEMGSLVFLQRIRKSIVDKVYLKTFGKKRGLS
jgi:hypothetical protein